MPGDGSSLFKSWLSLFQFVHHFWLARKERRITQPFLEKHGFDAGKMQNVIILLCCVWLFSGYLIVYLKNGTSNLQPNEHTTVYIKSPTWAVFPRYVFGSHLNVLRFTKLADCVSVQAILYLNLSSRYTCWQGAATLSESNNNHEQRKFLSDRSRTRMPNVLTRS